MGDEEFAALAASLAQILGAHGPALRYLVAQWMRRAPLAALATNPALPEALRSAALAMQSLPLEKLAPLLEARPADTQAGGPAPDLAALGALMAELQKGVLSAVAPLNEFVKSRTPLPAPLPPELDRALAEHEIALEGDLQAVLALAVGEEDINVLRAAKTPEEVIQAIVRDAPSPEAIAEISKSLEDVHELRVAAKPGAVLAFDLEALRVLNATASQVLAPILDPGLVEKAQGMVALMVAGTTSDKKGGQ